ncbi:MAG: EAL domain-containing protein [Deltaproteobacteria bacterium]|nr:MAG: EAL domain-containing protein [Deltaproteobacteria bacterium]
MFALRPELVVLGAESWRPAKADPSEARVVGSIVQAACSLGVRVVAEGVATAVERKFTRELGCALLAGPLLGPPASASTWSRAVVPRDRRRPR